ncbi:MAG: hypothetical protein HYZ49_11390 [Chloroflexi bacterium]|nr:hypothetical protein [Chloroflexota bacterium]
MNRLKDISPSDILDIAFNTEERAYLEKLAESSRLRDCKLCIRYLEASLRIQRNRKFVLTIADRLVLNNKVRHEALGIFQQFLDKYPEKIWPFVLKYGSHASRHVRESLATMVLEELMARYHDRYFPEVKRIVLSGDGRFLDILVRCWPFGQPLKKWHQTVRLIKRAGGDMSRIYVSKKYPLPV